jgi:hypothetical protein
MSKSGRKRDDWRKQWRAQCRRQLARDLKTRLLHGFARTYKPVLDDAPFRVFESMSDYRQWCEQHLPEYLGYQRVRAPKRRAR